MQDIYKLIFLSVIISFLGFVTENLWLLVTKGYMDNRNMILPFLSGYGILVVGFYLLFGTPTEMHVDLPGNRLSDLELFFILTFFTVSLGEIVLGMFAEKILGIIYWDYSWIPLHFTRYTSLPTSIGFTCIIVLFMKYCFTPIMDSLSLLPESVLGPVASIMFVIICLDTLHSFWMMHASHSLYSLWRIDLPHNTADLPLNLFKIT